MRAGSSLVVALLGVLRAGAVYLPLDPDWPAERRELMLADARARTVLDDPAGLADPLQVLVEPCRQVRRRRRPLRASSR